MKKGILIFAHNSLDFDYLTLAVISAGLAKKNLKVPVSLITDQKTVDSSKIDLSNIFEYVITIDEPSTNNRRMIYDGTTVKNVNFLNSSRSLAYNLSPYDRTLLIDSDYLILSDRLGNYWDVDADVLIGDSMKDIRGDRSGILDLWVSDVGVKMFWATTVMFSKTDQAKAFFDLVEYVKENYKIYSDIYRYDTKVYRNDIAFSVAYHMISGFVEPELTLPSILTIFDKDELASVNGNYLNFLIKDGEQYLISSIKEQDIHIMNKDSILRNKDQLLGLI